MQVQVSEEKRRRETTVRHPSWSIYISTNPYVPVAFSACFKFHLHTIQTPNLLYILRKTHANYSLPAASTFSFGPR